MSQYIALTSTAMRIKKSDKQAFFSAVAAEMDDYLSPDDFEITDEDDDSMEFCLDKTEDVGDSYQERIGNMANAIGPFLLEPCLLQVRTESMSDDRDSIFYAGASEEAISALQVEMAVLEADCSLQGIAKSTHPAAAAVPGIRASLEAVRSLATRKDNSPPVLHETPFGDIHLEAGKQFINIATGHHLIAASLREDGDADVVGSLNLDYLAFMDPDEARAAFSAFMHMHRKLEVLAIVESITDVLELPQSSPIDQPGNPL